MLDIKNQPYHPKEMHRINFERAVQPVGSFPIFYTGHSVEQQISILKIVESFPPQIGVIKPDKRDLSALENDPKTLTFNSLVEQEN